MTNKLESLTLLRIAVNDQDAEFRAGQWEAIDAAWSTDASACW